MAGFEFHKSEYDRRKLEPNLERFHRECRDELTRARFAVTALTSEFAYDPEARDECLIVWITFRDGYDANAVFAVLTPVVGSYR